MKKENNTFSFFKHDLKNKNEKKGKIISWYNVDNHWYIPNKKIYRMGNNSVLIIFFSK